MEELALGKQDHGNEEDEDEEEFVNPYPLEGKFKDESDKAYLNGLAEIERESILFDRSQEIEKYNQRLYLAQRARERKQQEKERENSSKATRSSTRDKGSNTKLNKLSELKKRREEKKHKERTRAPYRDDEYEDDDQGSERSDSDYGNQYSDNEESRPVEWAESKPMRDLSLDDLNKIRFSRTLLSKFCHNPGFGNAIIGAYVRVNIGYAENSDELVYRVCQVKDLQKTKPYKFMNRMTDDLLVVALGNSENKFEMGVCSDSPFTEDEFRWWKHKLERDGISTPSVKKVERKLKELVDFKDHVLTPDEVNELIQRRQKLSNSTGVGVVLEKSQLQQQRLVALDQDDMAEVERLDAKIAALESRLSSSHGSSAAHLSPLDKLAQVNIRNRRANQTGIRQAELRANEERRKTGGASVTGNPFSRLRTMPRIFHESETDKLERQAKIAKEEEELKKKVEADKKKEEEQKARVRKPSANEIDAMIAKIDIVLEVEI